MIAHTGTPTRTVLSLVITVTASGAFAGAHAQQQSSPAVQAKEHIVKKGDTLWGLAGFYFMNPYLWPTIFDANRDVIEDAHWIYPDERLRIPGVESGLPIAVTPQVERGAGPAPGMQPSQPNQPSYRSRFYVPPAAVDSSRENDILATRQPLLAVSAGEFRSAPWLEDSTDLGIRGRLVGLADPVTQNDKLTQFLHPYDRVLLGHLQGGELQVGDSMMIVRLAPPLGTFGNVVMPVALVRIDSLNERMASASIVRQFGEARAGDHVIPMPNLPDIGRDSPQPVSNGPEGRLVSFIDREPLYGTMDNGFIDLGEAQGVRVGDEFLAYVPVRLDMKGRSQLPEEQVGRLTVVKVMPTTSTVRVADASSTALQNGVRVRLVRKMR